MSWSPDAVMGPAGNTVRPDVRLGDVQGRDPDATVFVCGEGMMATSPKTRRVVEEAVGRVAYRRPSVHPNESRQPVVHRTAGWLLALILSGSAGSERPVVLSRPGVRRSYQSRPGYTSGFEKGIVLAVRVQISRVYDAARMLSFCWKTGCGVASLPHLTVTGSIAATTSGVVSVSR